MSTSDFSLDRTDIEILSTLFELNEASPKRIGERVGVPKSTVHFYEIEPGAAGFGVTLISEVTADYEKGHQDDVGSLLAAIDGVSQVYFTMGDTDFIVISNLPDTGTVELLISAFQEIESVQRTSSKFVIATVRNESNPLRNYSLESLLEVHDADS